MPKTLFLEWEEDLVLNQNGGLELASGWDEVRQRIIRRMLTNPQFKLADGTAVPAGYIFDTAYGIGMRRLVAEPYSQDLVDKIHESVYAAVLVDEGVDLSKLPVVKLLRASIEELWVIIGVVLKTGQTGTITFQVV